jgi:hypothetical protein
MSPWFRRRQGGLDSSPAEVAAAPETESATPEEELDPTGPLTPDRLDDALKRLRQEIPAPSEESPPGPSE